jgi:hypothetical protein
VLHLQRHAAGAKAWVAHSADVQQGVPFGASETKEPKNQMKTPTLNVAGVVQFFGGRGELYKKLSAAGIELSHRTIDNWLYHRLIPMGRFLELIAVAKANKLNLKIDDHLTYEN